MNCREFKSKHVGFIDDLLSAADMAEMRRHVYACTRCATLDVRIRRSLLVVRNLPQIEPSPDFFIRLNAALKEAPRPTAARQPMTVTATFVAVTAALAAAVYFAMASGNHPKPVERRPVVAANVSKQVRPRPSSSITDATMAAAVPAGVPVWPAMFMVGELPMHFANAELLDNGIGR
jgi:hypothetical protein